MPPTLRAEKRKATNLCLQTSVRLRSLREFCHLLAKPFQSFLSAEKHPRLKMHIALHLGKKLDHLTRQRLRHHYGHIAR
jgi:hypothetical protein